MIIEGSGDGSIPLTGGSGSGPRRPRNIWIRIRLGSGSATLVKKKIFIMKSLRGQKKKQDKLLDFFGSNY
jgi:hypothetical protein